MIQIPTNKQWSQPNNSDVTGTFWSTKNIDTIFTNVGKVSVGDRLFLNTSDTANYGQGSNISGMGCPIAFKSLTNGVYAIAGTKLVLNTSKYPSGSFSTFVPNTGSLPTNLDPDLSDMEYLNGYLYITGNSTSVSKVDSTTNISTITATGAGAGKKMLCSFQNRMYMSCNSTRIFSWDTADTIATTGTYTLQLLNSEIYEITFLRASSNRIWIGTVNTIGGRATVFEWDGSSTQPLKSYRLEAQGALSCVIKNDTPYIVDSNGNLLVFNGGTFKTLTGFNREGNQFLYNPAYRDNHRFIHPNGTSLINGVIHINIDSRNYNSTLNTEETIPSGVYFYESNTNSLIHRYSFSYQDRLGVRTENEDYGQYVIYRSGAISEVSFPDTSSSRNGSMLVGASVYIDASSTLSGIWFDDSNRTKQKAGYFVTPKVFGSLNDTWLKIYLRYRQLLASSDKIVVKYRTVDQDPITATITWTSTTTFTTTTDISAYTNYEVEVLQGIGAGKCSHITSIVNNAGTYTVTVDETYTGASGTAIARFQKWIKAGYVQNQTSSCEQFPVGDVSTWIQVKVFMIFTGKDEIEDMFLINQPSQTLV